MVKLKNPVLPGFYPDPSVCRVGSDYYVVTSSFEYFPGVPIFHSRDLVNFRQIGHCLTRDSQLPLDKAVTSQGIWAPTLRHQDGVFYLVTTNTGGGGNFYVTARDPSGPWSEPIFYDQDGIDPSIFFDDDGTAYFTNAGLGIQQSTFEPKTGKRTSDTRPLWSGSGGRYPEAPHLYKIRGIYYLVLAEGGTELGHMVTIARAKTPWGPFEACPFNPILSHRDDPDHPIQCTGHADLVEAHDGSFWLVALGVRLQGRWVPFHHLGRETFLAPVEWGADGWPRVNGNGTIPLELEAPSFATGQDAAPPVRDDFGAPELSLVWNFRHNPVQGSYSLEERPGWLRLRGTADDLNIELGGTFVGRRQQHYECRAATLLDFEPADGDEAGLSAFMNPGHHYEVFVTRRAGERLVQVRRTIGDLSATSEALPLPPGPTRLEIRASALLFRLGFCAPDGAFRELASGSSKYLSKEVAGGFMGMYFALYATGNGKPQSADAYFDWFDYEPAL